MNHSSLVRAAFAAVTLLASSFALTPAHAAITDYAFELVEAEVQQGEATIVSVRLVDKRTGALVPDAVIIEQRVDMAPDGMETMAGALEALPPTEPGVYPFKAGLIMQGGWRLSLSAKVQGEEGTLESKLEFKVLP